jgi:hypothetical protein
LLVYLDTNIFDNLTKKTGGVTQTDERRLREAVSSRQLTIVVSQTNVREAPAALEGYPRSARANLGLIMELADWDRFVRLCPEILEEDIRHFAYNSEGANTPFVRSSTRVQSILRRVINGPIGIREAEAAIHEDRKQKQTFMKRVKEARAQTTRALEEFKKKSGEIPSFDEFFIDGAEERLFDFIKSFDVAEECKRRGLDKMLRIPSMRAMVGFAMSYIYGIVVERITPKRSDLRDFQHAPSAAAAADILVTHDKDFAFLLGRVPIKGFRVMRLRELLEDTLDDERS